MSDPSFIPESERELLAVFPTQRQAVAAKSALLEAGVPETAVRVDRDADTVASLRAEMHQEMTDSWVVPNAGVVYPKESAQGLMMWSVVAGAIGLVAAFPLALIDFGGSYWLRFLIWAVVGVAFGLTVALVAGPASTSKRPATPAAAHDGAVVRVTQDSPELRRLLADLEPMRLDEVSHQDQPIEAVAPAEGQNDIRDRAEEIVARSDGDDFHEPRD